MATLTLPYTLVPDTLAKASEVQGNFDSLRSFITAEVVQKDASIAFTAIPAGPTLDPSSQNQLLRNGAIRRGIHTASGSGGDSHTGTITFGYTFAAPPIVVGTCLKTASQTLYLAWETEPTTTTVGYRVVARDVGANFANQYKIYWAAYSVLP